MKVTYIETECRDKISKDCTKTFMRKVQRGRPQINCDACKASKTAPAATSNLAKAVENEIGKRVCPCGVVFDITPGPGRKPSKCDGCRSAGIVYRQNNDGEIETIQAAQLAEEQRERAEAEGRERADRLVEMMRPLLEKRNRTVIAH